MLNYLPETLISANITSGAPQLEVLNSTVSESATTFLMRVKKLSKFFPANMKTMMVKPATSSVAM